MVWEELRAQLAPQLAGVVEADELIADLRPCWIFVSSVRQARAAGRTDWPEPEVGAAKLGGLPDMPESTPWPTTAAGEPMDFLAQVRLDDGPALPGLPEAGSILFFSGTDDPPENVEHALIYVDAATPVARTERPDGPRFDHSKDYNPLPLRWTPSFEIPRTGRYFHTPDGEEVSDSELQRALHAAAFAHSGEPPKSYEAMTTFGGWPENDGLSARTAIRAYIADSEFADHDGYYWDFQRAYDLVYGKRPLDELKANPSNELWTKLVERIESDDPYLRWVRDPNIDHAAGIAEWRQLLSLDSHMELDMCFWDAGRYEFVCHEQGMADGSFRSRLDLCGFG